MVDQQTTTITPEQVKAAAAAGVGILNDTNLRVPMDVAVSGALGTLKLLLMGVANGALVFSSPPMLGEVSPTEKPVLREVKGGDDAA